MEKIKAKINEAFGNNQSPGIRTLVVLFKQLEQAEERLGKNLLLNISVVEYQKRIEQLHYWHFDVQKYPQLADFLVRHWDGIVYMANAVEWNRPAFFWILPDAGKFINETTWPGLIEMVKAAGGTPNLFLESLPLVSHFFNEKNWPIIVKGFVEISISESHYYLG